MRHFLTFIIAGFFFSGLAAPVAAQNAPDDTEDEQDEISSSEVVLWDVEGGPPQRAALFRQAIADALENEPGTHLIDREDFSAWVADQAGPLPDCYKGLAPCVSAKALAFDALGLSLAVRVIIGEDAVQWAAIDNRGQVVEKGEVSAETPREAAFELVAKLFDATGTVRIESVPEGARVQIDGVTVGVTPHLTRLPVGKHTFSLSLDQHRPETGEFEIRSSGTDKIRRTLEEFPGVLLIEDAPEGAQILVNGEVRGEAGEPIELGPGSYAIEVSADGYATRRDAVTIAPGERIVRSAPLDEANPFLRSFGKEAIARNNYIFRLGYEHGFQSSTYQDARSGDDRPFEFRTFADDNGNQPGIARSETVHGNGLRADFSYGFENFGIVVLSLTYYAASLDEPIFVTTPDGSVAAGRLTGLDRLQIRPFQIFYRYFYKNFVPFAEVGTGIDFQWLAVESEVFDSTTLTQSDALVTLGMGAQYFFTPNLFAHARYSIQGYFDSAHGADHLLSIGIGGAVGDLFGFDPEPPESL